MPLLAQPLEGLGLFRESLDLRLAEFSTDPSQLHTSFLLRVGAHDGMYCLSNHPTICPTITPTDDCNLCGLTTP